MNIGSRQRLLGESDNEICVELENHRIERVDHTKSLNLTVDVKRCTLQSVLRSESGPVPLNQQL